jgi:HlyD family secretion protein
VVVTLQDPPSDLRPGLSATAKITTATRSNALTIPIQALTVRKQSDLVPAKSEKGSVQAAGPQTEAPKGKDDKEIQGVFILRNHKAEFAAVDTGIAGTTDIEVLKGLTEGDEIITGSYKVLRTLRPGSSVKVDNSAPKQEDQEGS